MRFTFRRLDLASFDVPAIIGMANRIFTFSTFVYIHANPEDGPPNFGIVGAASVFMILVALLLSWLYVRVIRQSHKYSVVTGKNYRPRIVELGRWWIVGWMFIGAKLLLGVVLPFLMLVWASLIPYFQPFSMAALDLVSLENFYRIPWDRFWDAARNTAILTVTVPTLLVVIGVMISWVVIRSGSKYAGLIDTAAFMPHAVPNLIFSVAILVVALFWLPEFIPFYNTIYILIASFIVARISFPTRVYNNALLQIHKELDEAAYVSGLGTTAGVAPCSDSIAAAGDGLRLDMDGATLLPGADAGRVFDRQGKSNVADAHPEPGIGGPVHHRRGGFAAVVCFHDSAGDFVFLVWPTKFSDGRPLKHGRIAHQALKDEPCSSQNAT